MTFERLPTMFFERHDQDSEDPREGLDSKVSLCFRQNEAALPTPLRVTVLSYKGNAEPAGWLGRLSHAASNQVERPGTVLG
jgi:hypothetical protein